MLENGSFTDGWETLSQRVGSAPNVVEVSVSENVEIVLERTN